MQHVQAGSPGAPGLHGPHCGSSHLFCLWRCSCCGLVTAVPLVLSAAVGLECRLTSFAPACEAVTSHLSMMHNAAAWLMDCVSSLPLSAGGDA